MICDACGTEARALQPALVTGGPNEIRPGKVCSGCAKLGWLIVFGPDATERAAPVAAVESEPTSSRRRKRGERHTPGPLPKSSRPTLEWTPGLAAELERQRARVPADEMRASLKDLKHRRLTGRTSRRPSTDVTAPVPKHHPHSEVFDAMEEDQYQKFKARLLRELKTEDPLLLRTLATVPELEVTTQRKVIELDASTLRGRLAQLAGEGFFDEPATGNAAFLELKRVGFRTSSPNVYRELDKLAELALFTKEKDGYQRNRAVRVRLKESRA